MLAAPAFCGGTRGIRGMSASGSELSRLRDGRLAPLATAALPAWLWSPDASHIVWTNAVGAAVFGAATTAAIRSRRFDARELAVVQIARIAPTLATGAQPRLARLRGFGAGIGRALTCACSRIALSEETTGILVVAVERPGSDLPLGERVARLLAGGNEPIAAFAADGTLMAATESAHAYLDGASSLAALEAQTLAAAALADGHAALASEASGQRGKFIVRPPDTRPEPGSSAHAALASEASGQRGKFIVRARSASEDARERADDTLPEPGSSAQTAPTGRSPSTASGAMPRPC